MKNAKIELTPKGTATFFGFVATCLVVVHFLTFIPKYTLGNNGNDTVAKLLLMFNLDEERNIPTFFSTVLILSCSLLLFIIAALQGKNGKNRKLWLGLALVFLFLSFDEAFALHERLTKPLRSILHTSGIFYFAWMIPYALLVGIMTVCYAPFLLKLPKHPRNLMFIAGILYISGALGMEMLGGWYWSKGQRALIFDLIATCEEVLEMAGMILFQYALFVYIGSVWTNVHIQLAIGSGIESENPTEKS
jgi:hypothetical protein